MVVISISSVLQSHINNAPDWVCWVAQDSDGWWRGYDKCPVIGLIPSGIPGNHQMYESWEADIDSGTLSITSTPLFQAAPNVGWKETRKRVRRRYDKQKCN